MSHFNLQAMLTDLTQFTDPIPTGSNPRWQRNGMEKDGNPSVSKTPSKTPNTPSSKKGLSTINTPSSKTPRTGKQSKTPKKTPKTPSHDRFIPNRACTDIDRGHYAMMKGDEENSDHDTVYQSQLSDALHNGQHPNNARILHFREKLPEIQEHTNNLKVLYSTSRASAPKSASSRQIRQQPERILDAPDLLDDYYLNLIDWASTNHLIVALGTSLYLWNGEDGTISMLMEFDDSNDYISSVKVMSEGPVMAVGSSSGFVQLWDIKQQKCLRTMTGHGARVGTLSWNSYILSSGARSGTIHHHDVRVAEHQVATISAHRQEVCGLAWSPDGRYLASGGNDNLLNIWDASLDIMDMTKYGSYLLTSEIDTRAGRVLLEAIAWCPWQPQLLASGGGTADRHIRFWNTTSGACLNAVDTKSQVCAILWSPEYKELVSGHGYSQHQLSIWKYPTMAKVTDLTGHTSRVLSLAMSPDGTTIVSAAADETLRLWKCFEKKPAKSAKSKTASTASSLGFSAHSIR